MTRARRRRPRCLPSAILLFAVVTGLSAQSPGASREYRSTETGISVDVPSGWGVRDSSDGLILTFPASLLDQIDEAEIGLAEGHAYLAIAPFPAGLFSRIGIDTSTLDSLAGGFLSDMVMGDRPKGYRARDDLSSRFETVGLAAFDADPASGVVLAVRPAPGIVVLGMGSYRGESGLRALEGIMTTVDF